MDWGLIQVLPLTRMFVELQFGPYQVVMAFIVLATVPVQRILTRNEPEMRVNPRDLLSEIREKGYKWHISIYVLMYLLKAFIDQHNEAIKPRVGGFTHKIYALEGDITLWAQDTFRNNSLTEVLSFHYLFVYLFLIWFSPLYYILSRDEVMADKAVLNYLVMYVLAIPLYLFFNVEVSSSFIPWMDALLYHESWYLFFFTEVDPLDNGYPSLHIGIPICLLIINRLHVREMGVEIGQWRHREFDLFVMANVPIYIFSIQYLGIHWISDIVPGVILAFVCAFFTHKFQPRIRSIHEEGWSSVLPNKQVIATSSAFCVGGLICILGFVLDGPGTDEDAPTMRFGPGDVNLDVVEIHSLWHPAEVEIVNVGSETIEVLIVHRDLVLEQAIDGRIRWSGISGSVTHVLLPGESLLEEVSTPAISDGHFVLARIQGESGVGEARVTLDYVDDSLLWSAIVSSIPAFGITGIVVGELVWGHRSK